MSVNERWNAIIKSIEESEKDIQLLPIEQIVLNDIEQKYKIAPESTIGCIIYNTGGMVIDHWIRLYGAGKLNFAERNQIFPYNDIVIGEDILGGLFIILENGNIAYFAPDTLEMEDMEISFSQFLYWCVQGDTDTFYIDYRWENWKDEIRNMDLDKGVSFYPFLWAEADGIEARHREQIAMKEIISLEFDFLKQMTNSDI